MGWKVDNTPDNALVQINAKVKKEVRCKLKEKAKQANLNVSDFLAGVIEQSVIVSKPDLSADINKLNAWVGRVNGNVNALAKWANTYRENAFADLILMRLAEIQKNLVEVSVFTADLRAQGYGKRRKPRTAPKRGAK